MTTTKKAATGKPVVSVAAVETVEATPETVTDAVVEAEVVTLPVEAFDIKIEDGVANPTDTPAAAELIEKSSKTTPNETTLKVDVLKIEARSPAVAPRNDLEADVDEADEIENEVKGMPVDPLASYELTARIKKGKLPHWRSGLWFTREAKTYIMLGAHLSIVQSDPAIQIITMQLIEK